MVEHLRGLTYAEAVAAIADVSRSLARMMRKAEETKDAD